VAAEACAASEENCFDKVAAAGGSAVFAAPGGHPDTTGMLRG